jgi:hypothetical protein
VNEVSINQIIQSKPPSIVTPTLHNIYNVHKRERGKREVRKNTGNVRENGIIEEMRRSPPSLPFVDSRAEVTALKWLEVLVSEEGRGILVP